ncbi:2-oxoglutarate dehydrogenase, E2 component, dihydrolipoamide succinyltransferase [Actinomycetaceae bacterium MB13-C1-2]|nr:2-oxoglutarate dehydrogenase, E2 component, dihydrolipoamide succinyltransferase [Actinomycetaceae bacterium MB13-C1-2]
MAQSIKMPALGESVSEGTVTEWLKKVGDTVEADEPIVEVATDKVDSEVPSPVSGVLLEILVDEDETVDVGTEIARVGSPDEAGSAPVETAPAPEAAPAPEPTPVSIPASEPAPVATPAHTAGSPSTGNLTDVTMPALGESVSEGTVSEWLVSVGDKVSADDPLVEVATDKVDSEVPSPIDGYVAEILVEEDDTVDVGTVLVRISDTAPSGDSGATAASTPTEAVAAPTPATPVTASPAAPAVPATPTHAAPPPPPVPTPAATPKPDAHAQLLESVSRAASSEGQVVDHAPGLGASTGYVTPLVRKLAKEKGVDLSTVTGTGIGGRIRREDVEAAVVASAPAVVAPAAPVPATSTPSTSSKIVPSPEAEALRGTTEKMSRLRQTVARRMVESLQSSAQLTTVFEVDVTKVAALRAKYKDQFQQVHGTKLTFLPFFVKATIEALEAHPKLNAVIDDRQVTYHDHVNMGIAVDAPQGLMVPVIRDAQDLSIAGIAESINSLASKVRDGKISPDELTGSTFTITNTGSGGAIFDTPILNMPETGILGTGTIVKRPVVVKDADGGEAVAIRSMVYLSISYDHRLVDGADASRFLSDVKRRLEGGDFLADLQLG